MDVGTLLSVVQTLFATLQCSELKDVYSIFTYKKELEKLQDTVKIIRKVLMDAESKQMEVELSEQTKLWIEELKDALYDADDLVDEFVTLAKQKKLTKTGSFSQKVQRLFSRFNSPSLAHKMSKEVKEIKKRLDVVASNHNQFGFKFDCQPTRKRREETCSYVYSKDVIGRDGDVENIVGRLLDPDVKTHVSCVAIVGIGGLGKTTLAQLVYNDPRIKENFPLRLWTCVGDQDVERSDVKATLCKILHSGTSENHGDLSMEHLQRQLQGNLGGKKYFLVMDDLWNEVRSHWLELANFLMSGLKGSCILVTTRSEKTAMVIGDRNPYKLEGLSREDSWRLFVMAAFGEEEVEQADLDLVEIGQEIVERCANVPLAIRVIGTLLYGQDRNKWLSLQEAGLGRLKVGDKGTEPILKLSYHSLESQLKTCFSYCALFPKDYEIEKEMLIMLWIALGFVVPLDEGQCVEAAGEEYFSILLKRCFFQDIERDENGEIVTCKIHDLMHDIAEEVAGREILKGYSIPSNSINKVRHLFFYGEWDEDGEDEDGDEWDGVIKSQFFTNTKIRTCLGAGVLSQVFYPPLSFDTVLAKWKCLRVLDLKYSRMAMLPSTLSELLHLRYLDLSSNREMEVLPNSITKLHNLEFLILKMCMMLRELPKDLSKLTKLKVLDTTECSSLDRMPRDMGKLSRLWKLPYFVVDGRTSSKEEIQLAHQVVEIKALQNLKGSFHIKIMIHTDAEYAIENGRKGGCLSQHLTDIVITFTERTYDSIGKRIYEFDEALLEDLQPHPNLQELNLQWYCGRRLPHWPRVPKLVSVTLHSCPKLQHIAVLRKLPRLKSVVLHDLCDLEYIEDTGMSESTTRSRVEAVESQHSFFPSLEKLHLIWLPKLKGWWTDDNKSSQTYGGLLPSFPSLSELHIEDCSNLASMPLCPNIQSLRLRRCNINMRIMESIKSGNSKLTSVDTGNVGHLKLAMPMEAFQCLSRLHIDSDQNLEKLSEVEDIFYNSSSSLRELQIRACSNLRSINGGLAHLVALEKLTLDKLPCLNLSKVQGDDDDDDDDGMPWRCLSQTLSSLHLKDLPKLVKLPDGMCHLTALRSLTIVWCMKLEAMPGWMPELASLEQLHIEDCYTLEERCCDTDWHKIQHIPEVKIR